MKQVFLLCLLSLAIGINAQDKSVVLYKTQNVLIGLDKDGIRVEENVSEERSIAKGNNVEDYTFSVYFDNFSDVDKLQGATYDSNRRKISSLGMYDREIRDAEQSYVFHSDRKVLNFRMPKVVDNSIIQYSYRKTYKEPKLIPPIVIQNYLRGENISVKISCDPGVEIGYKLFGDHNDKIKHTISTEGNRKVYLWEASEMPVFEPEGNMPSIFRFLPHIIYYIKSYTFNGKKVVLLEKPEDLQKWYTSLTTDINKKDISGIKAKTNELTANKNSALEKAKAIFNWVQDNLHYIAFEFEMGGFIPRDAVDVFDKKYGDCKDMANLLHTMLSQAGIQSSLTWIGTRDKPYSYADVNSPLVDNHMITSFEENGTRYYLDATDKYCQFGFPSEMIQGKEALIKLSDGSFLVETVPIPDAEKSVTNIVFDLKISGTSLIGSSTMKLSGFSKTRFLSTLAFNTDKESEVWKAALTGRNVKIKPEIVQSSKNTYADDPTTATYQISLDNWLKDLDKTLIIKPILLFPLKDMTIDLGKRKYPVDLNNKETYQFEYRIELPTGYHIEHLPENVKISNQLADFELQYLLEDNRLLVKQMVSNKQLIIEKDVFQTWADFIKSINKHYNQSVVFTK
jgi:hypothetical protein